MTYCFVCPLCGWRDESQLHDGFYCPNDGSLMRRDWRAEGVGVAVLNLKTERNVGKEEAKRLFLPHNDDFKGPDDPDGTRGMRAWREEHQPRPTNKSPDWPGYVERKVF